MLKVRVSGNVKISSLGGHFVQLLDVIEKLLAPRALLCARDKMRGEFFPLLLERVEEKGDVLLQFARLVLVRLCENDAKGDAVFAQPFDKFEVNLLRRQARVDEHE